MGGNLIKLYASGTSDIGLKRSINEDSYLVDQDNGLFLVADGMGGHSGGNIASDLFLTVVKTRFGDPKAHRGSSAKNRIENLFNAAHLEIQDQVKRAPRLRGMGCTANILLIENEYYTIGHVGDSRAYLLRESALHQLTTDHSFVQQQIELGLLTPEQARTHKMRSVILQAIGVSDTLSIDILEGKVQPGDLFMVCTDGLYTMLEEKQLEQILTAEMSLDQKCDILIKLANGAGGEDNVTVVLVSIVNL